MRYHTGSPRNNRHANPQPRCGLLLFVLVLSLPSSWLVFLPSLLTLSSFCCPSVGHIIGLTAPPANKNSNIIPSGLSLLPERMFVFVSFICVFSPLFLSVFFAFLVPLSATYLRGTWYICWLNVDQSGIPDRISLCCGEKLDVIYATWHIAVHKCPDTYVLLK